MEFEEKHSGKIDIMNFFEQFILAISNNKTAKYLNTTDNSMLLASPMIFKDEAGDVKYRKIFSHKYPLSEIMISPQGEIICDFEAQFKNAESQFIKESKIKHMEAVKSEEELRIRMLKAPEEKQKLRKLRQEEAQRNDSNSFIPKGSILSSDPYGTCVLCGQYTNEWSIYNYKDKTCKCKECMIGMSKK